MNSKGKNWYSPLFCVMIGAMFYNKYMDKKEEKKMPVMDEFKEERERIKSASLREKIGYYTYYYKFHALGVIVALAIIISVIHTIVTHKDTGIYVAITNSYGSETTSDDYEEEFANIQGLSADEYQLIYDTSLYLNYDNQDSIFMTTVQKLITLISSRQVDVFVSESMVYEQFYGNGMFMDLRNVLTPEEIEEYKSNFYYVDYAEMEAYDIAVDNGQLDYVLPEYDHRDPGSMKEPMPIGIYLDKDNEFLNNYQYRDTDVIISLVSSTDRVENGLAYLRYVLQ